MNLLFVPLTTSEQRLVRENLEADPATLVLKWSRDSGINAPRIVQQIVSAQKAKSKLPGWYNNPAIFFPPPVSVEQASSEATAAYKASLINGAGLADITLGMGVDTFYFSKNFRQVFGYEIDPGLAAITRFNLKNLGAENVRVFDYPFTPDNIPPVEWVYADPSRRTGQNRKTIAFKDASPDILRIVPGLVGRDIKLMIKASPMIDISQAVSQLGQVAQVHVIGYRKECKEVVFILNPEKAADVPVIHAAVVDESGNPVYRLSFRHETLTEDPDFYGDPSGFLYEPHPAFLKTGGFNQICIRYGVHKISPNSHLYFSEELRTDFPGRLFKIKGVESASGFQWKKWLKEAKANITTRNFPVSPDDLRKKLRLKEGGDDYLFATTLLSGKRIIIITHGVAN